MDVALCALKIDPVNCALLEGLLVQGQSVLVGLHRAASAFLALVFTQYAAQRRPLVSELLGILNQTYAAKQPYKSFALQFGTRADEGGVRYTTMALVTLLSCFQGVVSLQDAVGDANAVNETAAPTASTAAKPASKGRGRKLKAANIQTVSDAESSLPDAAAADCGPQAKEAARRSMVLSYSCGAAFVSELFQVCSLELRFYCFHFNDFVLFCNMLFQRSESKEAGAEYRALCSNLVSELLVLMQLPAWPAAAILLEQILLGVLRQLGPSTEDRQSARRDTSLTGHLLDLLGSACVGMRAVINTTEREEKAADSFRLSPEVQESLSNKVASLKYTWLTQAKSHISSSAKKAGKGKKKETGISTASILDVSTALLALMEITASTVDVLLEQPSLRSSGSEEGDGGSSTVTYSCALSALPPPVAILENLPRHSDLLR